MFRSVFLIGVCGNVPSFVSFCVLEGQNCGNFFKERKPGNIPFLYKIRGGARGFENMQQLLVLARFSPQLLGGLHRPPKHPLAHKPLTVSQYHQHIPIPEIMKLEMLY